MRCPETREGTASASGRSPPLTQNALDEVESSLERGFYTQFRCIEQVSVVSRHQRGGCTAGVAFIAAVDVGKHLFEADVLAAACVFKVAALGAGVRLQR
jgi:hypothetical protein